MPSAINDLTALDEIGTKYFCLSCAEALFPALVVAGEEHGRSDLIDRLRSALDCLWEDQAVTDLDLDDDLQRDLDGEESWLEDRPLAENAAAAGVYALTVGSVQDSSIARWSAMQVTEAIDAFAQSFDSKSYVTAPNDGGLEQWGTDVLRDLARLAKEHSHQELRSTAEDAGKRIREFERLMPRDS